MQKAFNKDVDESWVDWAIEMIEAGYESEHLYMHAGITRPYNQFELQQLTDKVFAELNLHYRNKERVTKDYMYYLVSIAIDKPSLYLLTLWELKNICIDFDMASEYMNFYLLYFAKDDLSESENQWYWEGATRKNIDHVVKNEFLEWIKNYENKNGNDQPLIPDIFYK